MAGLSRTEKYKDLRSRLQDDTGSDLSTKALNPYETRLNQIDANNFAAPDTAMDDEHSAAHAREVTKEIPIQQPLHRTQHEHVEPSFNEGFKDNENYSAAFDNDYLNQYIREVKQYNLEQGSALSDNTQINVLRQLEGNKNGDASDPYAKFGNSPLNMPKAPAELDTPVQTAEIPFQKPVVEPAPAPVVQPVQTPAAPEKTDPRARVQIIHQNAPVSNSRKTFTEDLFENDDEMDNVRNTQNLTKEDIMAEVQNLVNGTKQQDYSTASQNTGYDRNFDDGRTARQQLLNETTQMRAQLDDYEDNLNEVSSRMQHTNKILNIVLIVLIIALAVILGIVIYWIVLAKG